MSFDKPRIFIASSGRAANLAEALAGYLNDVAEPEPWRNAFPLGGNTLNSILEKAGICDFAAVFLTEDDVMHKGDHETLVPRDNCIFELGLFMGALDLDPRRCFMLVSVNKEALPSDLKGITYVPMKKLETGDLSNTAECQKAITTPVSGDIDSPGMKVKKAIQDLKHLNRKKLPLLTKPHLMGIERHTKEGGLLVDPAEVVVKSIQPLDREFDFATLVQENMQSGANARYRYFFYLKLAEDNLRIISSLVQTLAVGGIDDLENSTSRKLAMSSYKAKIEKNLDTMKKNLSICFFTEDEPVDFCVYNAVSEQETDARSFLRYYDYDNSRSGLVEWYRGTRAKQLASRLKKLCKKVNSDLYIFRPTDHFDLYDPQNQDLWIKLEDEIVSLFHPDLTKKVIEVCFGSSVHNVH